jgi:hypothetical protein
MIGMWFLATFSSPSLSVQFIPLLWFSDP